MSRRHVYAIRASDNDQHIYLRTIRHERSTGFSMPKYTYDLSRALIRATPSAAERHVKQVTRLSNGLEWEIVLVPVVAEYRVWEYGVEETARALAAQAPGRAVARLGEFFLVLDAPSGKDPAS